MVLNYENDGKEKYQSGEYKYKFSGGIKANSYTDAFVITGYGATKQEARSELLKAMQQLKTHIENNISELEKLG